jgi:uncharacterized protein (DUF697 family)
MLPLTLEELDAIRAECRAMVTSRAALSAGAAVLPLPGVDVGADVLLLLEMIPAINHRFGLSPHQIERLSPHYRRLVLVALTSLGSELAGRVVTRQRLVSMLGRLGPRKSARRLLPVVGPLLAASVSFGAMKLVGNAHIEECYRVARHAILAAEREAAGH